MNCIPTVKSPFHFLNPNFKILCHPNPSQILILPQSHANRKPFLSHYNKSPNLNLTAKKRNIQVKASVDGNNGKSRNWVSWLPTGGLAADKILRLISTATSSPICQFISSPTTFLHSVDPRIKLVWLLALVVLPARSQIVVRFGLVAYIALLSVLVLPKHVWVDQLGRVSLLCGILFILCGLGTDGIPQLVQSRTPSSSITGLPELHASLSGYSYLIMKLGPLRLTRKGLSVASTASCLTFTILQSASLCLATTTPEQLAFALQWFMLPLRRIGVPVAEIVLTLMLSLRFINLVFDEVRNVALGIVSRRINWQQLTVMETIDIFASYIRRIFKNIFSHAEQISEVHIQLELFFMLFLYPINIVISNYYFL
ncbi:Cobalt ion transmembrane transporters isoform 2 [Theobroma cacao]|uniref:Cobalt ion transmembrane transporters isoform 2 n=1 Tax=Theobroma cacao TaxID=3641 RepID=A0A061ELC6_THECC|nr:Cobalt ion transmembrane transporters isoform 2 [Theobroma cacao]